jgi:hypothetical protein
VIPELDPFDPKNGYNPKGPSNYSKQSISIPILIAAMGGKDAPSPQRTCTFAIRDGGR